MKWLPGGRCIKEVYHIISGDWTICKISVRGVVSYELWRAKKFISRHATSEEAKRAARAETVGTGEGSV